MKTTRSGGAVTSSRFTVRGDRTQVRRRLLESRPPGPPDEFGSRATVPSEPCQIRKEAALRRKARAPRIARTHRGARGNLGTVRFVSESAYVPLARKWRPRTFADVVGQEE